MTGRSLSVMAGRPSEAAGPEPGALLLRLERARARGLGRARDGADHLHAFLEVAALDRRVLSVRDADLHARGGDLSLVVEVPEQGDGGAVAGAAAVLATRARGGARAFA